MFVCFNVVHVIVLGDLTLKSVCVVLEVKNGCGVYACVFGGILASDLVNVFSDFWLHYSAALESNLTHCPTQHVHRKLSLHSQCD